MNFWTMDQGRVAMGEREREDERRREHGLRSRGPSPEFREQRMRRHLMRHEEGPLAMHGGLPGFGPSYGGRGVERAGHPMYDEPGYGQHGGERLVGDHARYLDLSGPSPRLRTRPKNYRRPDERIREDVWERLLGAPELEDVWDLDVTVADGEVRLTGNVPERRMRFRAEQLCEQVSGVKDVQNDLKVRRSR